MLHRDPVPATLRAGALATVVVLAAFATAACSRSKAQTAPPPPPEVDAAQVVSRAARHWDEFSGRTAAPDAVEVRARVSGYIERVALKEGDEVKPGALLFVIDP